MRRRDVRFLILFALALPLFSQDSGWMRAEFWIDMETVPGTETAKGLSEPEAAESLLAEAAWIYACMHEGFSFEWRPADLSRAIEEEFSVRWPSSAKPGDRRLVPKESRREGSRLRAYVEYVPDSADLAMRSIAQSPQWRTARGIGKSAISLGLAGRRLAYERAAQAAIENLARSVEPNRPRVIRGRALFLEVPSMAVRDGSYLVKAQLRIEIREIVKREVF